MLVPPTILSNFRYQINEKYVLEGMEGNNTKSTKYCIEYSHA